MRFAEPEFGQEEKELCTDVSRSSSSSSRSRWDGAASRDWRSQPPPTRRLDLSLKSCGRRTPFTSVPRGRWSGMIRPSPPGVRPDWPHRWTAGDMGSAVPALLAISLILTAFLVGGALGLVDLPVKLRGGLAAAHAPAAPRRSAARTTAAAVCGPPPRPARSSKRSRRPRRASSCLCDARSCAEATRRAPDSRWSGSAPTARTCGSRNLPRSWRRTVVGSGAAAPRWRHTSASWTSSPSRAGSRPDMAKLGTKPSSNRKGSLVSDHGQEVRNVLSRADVLTTAMLAGAGVAAGARAARRPRRRRGLAAVEEAGRRDPQLRPAAGRAAGSVLRRRAPAGLAQGRAAAVRRAGRRPGGGTRRARSQGAGR